jgi:SulP family sulfate permease
MLKPKLIDSLKNYSRDSFTRDLGAGVAVGFVALPLAMAFAIASGLPPQVGLLTSIIAGLLTSSLGGCKLQIGGPAGAFIVLVYSIVQTYGVAGLITATMFSGVLLF